MLTAKTSTNGQIVIPETLRHKLRVKKGDVWEFVEGDHPGVLVMRRVNPRSNAGLISHLRACPHPFDPPAPSRERPRRVKL